MSTVMPQKHGTGISRAHSARRAVPGRAFPIAFMLSLFFPIPQKLPPRFSSVSITTVQSGETCCITKYICAMGMATQPPV